MQTCFSIPHRRTTYLVFVLLTLALSWMAFGNLSGHLINAEGDEQDLLHDVQLIKTNPASLVSPDRWAPVRPPLDLLFLIAHTLWGHSPVGYHLLQIGLHLLATLLLAYTLVKLGADRELALLSALFFLLNVAHFRSVQWVILINYILAFIFSLTAVIHHARFLESNRLYHRLFTLTALAAAVFTHPSSAAVALFCLYLSWQKQRALRPLLTQGMPLLLVVLILAIFSYLVSPQHQQAQGLISNFDFNRILSNPFWYLGRLLSTSFWLTSAGVGNIPAAWEIGLGGLGFLSAYLLFKHRIFPVADWAIWAILMVLPFANNALDRQIVGPSRQLYLASAGTSVALAWALRALVVQTQDWLTRRQKQIVFATLLAGLLLASGVSLKRASGIDSWLVGRSYEAIGRFKVALAQYHLALREGDSILPSEVYAYLAVTAFGQGRLPHRELAQGLAHYPDDLQLNLMMGIAKFAQDGSREGEKQIRHALNADPINKKLLSQAAISLCNLGISYHNYLKRHQDAARLFQKALDLQPNYTNAYYNLGNAQIATGNLKEAKIAFQSTIQRQPNYILAHRNLGAIYFQEGHYDKAISSFQQAVRLAPKDLLAQLTLADAYAKTDRFQQAVQTCQNAILQHPDSSRVYRKLGAIYFNQGQYQDAAAAFQQAVKKAPQHTQANFYFAQALHFAGNIQAADQQYQKTLALLPDTSSVRQRILAMYDP